MFCNRTRCALVLMVALAQRYGDEGIEIREIAQTHNLPLLAFKGVVEQLEDSGLIVKKNDSKLSLKLSPEKITIWQVVACVSEEKTPERSKRLPRQKRTSTVVMINKEDELLRDIISWRLKRYKLSAWSEKVSNTVYI